MNMPQTTRNTKRSNGFSLIASFSQTYEKNKPQTFILQHSSNLEAKYKH